MFFTRPADALAAMARAVRRDGTLAIAVGSIIASVEGESLPPTTVPAAVYSITMYLICVPFVLWRRRET